MQGRTKKIPGDREQREIRDGRKERESGTGGGLWGERRWTVAGLAKWSFYRSE